MPSENALPPSLSASCRGGSLHPIVPLSEETESAPGFPVPPLDTAEDVEVSILMPCLDEARTVGGCVEKAWRTLRRMGLRGEVIVADNGSIDGSREVARTHGAQVLEVPRRGYGCALRAGIAAARGRYVVMGDADDSYDFTQVGPFIERLREGHDLVVGNRFLGGICPGAMPWLHQNVGNPVLSRLLNLFFRSSVGDVHCGLRAFRKASYDRLGLTSTGMEFASEMVVRACLHRQKVSEVPIVLYPDGRGRRSHLRTFRDGWRHLRLLLLFCPTWLYLVPAAVMSAIGIALMAWLTPGPRKVGGVVLDVHTMLLGALWVLLAYQAIFLWAYAKMYGWSSGLLPPDTFSSSLLAHFSLEKGLLAGLVLLLTGLGLNLWLSYHWWERGFGPLDVQMTLRYALWGFVTMQLGVQTIFGSFFLGMLGMDSRFPEG
jgi:Glycosyl transferase family 2